jgi:hypothetical protein
MTHDELLEKVSNYKDAGLGSLVALRSVVALHKPYQHEAVSYVFCVGCTLDLDLAPPYPCETIQAIEKELI